MAMSIGTSGGPSSDINITPYIDILLVLLIIFMVIQPTIQYDLEARVPQEMPEDLPEDLIIKSDAIVVSIDTQGALRINQDDVTLDLLGTRLFDIYSARANKNMFIQGDEDLPFGDVVNVIDIAKGAGAIVEPLAPLAGGIVAFDKIGLWRDTAPRIPIETRGQGVLAVGARISIPPFFTAPSVYLGDFTDRALVHHLNCLAIRLMGVDLNSHLRDELVLGGVLGQPAAFVNIVRQRFLSIDVFAQLHGGHGSNRMHVIGRPGRFRAEQQHIARLESKTGQGLGSPRREQDQPSGPAIPLEGVPVGMPDHMSQRPVIQRRALHRPVVQTKAGGLDDVQFDAETGRQADARAHVLRNGWLKKGETHSKALLRVSRGLVAAGFASVSQPRAVLRR